MDNMMDIRKFFGITNCRTDEEETISDKEMVKLQGIRISQLEQKIIQLSDENSKLHQVIYRIRSNL